LRNKLSNQDIDVSSAEDSGQLAISDAAAVYYPEGSFTAEEMWQRLRDAYDTSIEDGHKGWRGSGEMSWALNDIPGNDQLIRYEYGLNNEIAKRPFTAMCQYNANLFSGAMLMEVLRVHPYMVSRGEVINNPYYKEMSH
jgi:DcmR-like sensory protein